MVVLRKARTLLRLSADYAACAGFGHQCSVCGWNARRFLTHRGRRQARCVHCGSLERHRVIWRFLQTKTNLFDGRPKDVLHIAPEAAFEKRLRKTVGLGYVTADLTSPKAAVRMDVCDNPFREERFDVVLCSHVLEHVPDDQKAIREFHRILRKGGWAMLVVPLRGETTQEDPNITSPEERARLYGQANHLRLYGLDFSDRVAEAGFEVKMHHGELLFSEEEFRRAAMNNTHVVLASKA